MQLAALTEVYVLCCCGGVLSSRTVVAIPWSAAHDGATANRCCVRRTTHVGRPDVPPAAAALVVLLDRRVCRRFLSSVALAPCSCVINWVSPPAVSQGKYNVYRTFHLGVVDQTFFHNVLRGQEAHFGTATVSFIASNVSGAAVAHGVVAHVYVEPCLQVNASFSQGSTL